MANHSFSWLDVLFPGVFIHEIAHALACYACGVKVHSISVHRSSGMVVHDKTSVRASLLIGLFPLIVGGILAFLILQLAKSIWDREPGWGALLLWIGFSIGFHCIPSVQDIQNIVSSTERRFGELWKGKRNLGIKLAKSGVYGIAWIGAWALVVVAALVNFSILFRILMGIGLLAMA